MDVVDTEDEKVTVLTQDYSNNFRLKDPKDIDEHIAVYDAEDEH